MLFYVEPERREALRARLKRLLCVPFSMSNRGSYVVHYEPEEPYEAALATHRDLIYSDGPREGAAQSGNSLGPHS
jgi:hypothetical protein